MVSDYYISIKRLDGHQIKLRPGAAGELRLVDSVKEKLKAEGIGWFVSEEKVLAAVEQAFHAAMLELKSDVIP